MVLLLTVDVDADIIAELARADNGKLSAFLAKIQSCMVYDLGYSEEQAEIFADRLAGKIKAHRIKKHNTRGGNFNVRTD